MLSFLIMSIKDTRGELNKILDKSSQSNLEKILKYSLSLIRIQESTEKKYRRCYNHRLHEDKVWEYMTKDIIENHKKNIENTMKVPCYDIGYRSRFNNVKIIDENKYIKLLGKNHNKVLMADYLMFNPYYILDYNMIDRLLPYCKINIIDDYTYKIDGWILEFTPYGTPSNKIRYDNSTYDTDKFITTEEDKRLAVRLFIQVMNETPEEYVNMNNYNVIAEWYNNNDNYLNSYNMNNSLYNINIENKKKESNTLSKEELSIVLDDKIKENDVIDILNYSLKYGKGDIDQIGVVDIKPKNNANELIEFNSKKIDLNKYYKENGYISTRTVIDIIQNTIKYRINCNNYLKKNGEKITKEELLAALYNSSLPLGMGITQGDGKTLSVDEAKELFTQTGYFDYYKGTPIKTGFNTFPIMDYYRFDKYNGEGKFMECIRKIQDNKLSHKEKVTNNYLLSELKRMSKII